MIEHCNPGHRRTKIIFALAFGVLATLAYLPSFNAWFFLDDFRIILENPALQNVFDPGAVWRFSQARFVASLSLAANYSLHDENVFGYHLVNFLIHLGTGLALWLLLKAVLRSPAMQPAPGWVQWVPWIAVAIFLLHPLQTQAVTYIVQRYTSLMAMLYLASMAAFAWARVRGSPKLLVLAIGLAALAFLSKQTAATLPLAGLLIELLFFRQPTTRQWLAILLSAATLAVMSAWLLTLPAFDINGLTRETDRISRIDYLATQMEVLWRYLGLFLLIGPQRLEYDISIAQGFSSISTWLYALGHTAVLAAALSQRRKWPMLTFAIAFHYLAHIIESSWFPIIDLVFEHRTYLPNAGLATAAALALAWLINALPRYRIGSVGCLFVVAGLTLMTWSRNNLWADQIAFLQNDARLSPQSQRAWTSLGKELMREARFEQALQALETAREIGLDRDGGELRPPTLLNIIFALHYTERNHEALELAEQIDIGQFNARETAFYYEARGRTHLGLGNATAAREDLTRAARVNPSPAVITFLASAELQLGNHARARQLARQVLEVEPQNGLAREILNRTR